MITISRKALAAIAAGVLVAVAAIVVVVLVVSSKPDGPERFTSVDEFARAFVAATDSSSVWRTKSNPAGDLQKVAMGACSESNPTPEQVTRTASLSYAMDLDDGGQLYVANGITEAELIDLRVRSLGLCGK